MGVMVFFLFLVILSCSRLSKLLIEACTVPSVLLVVLGFGVFPVEVVDDCLLVFKLIFSVLVVPDIGQAHSGFFVPIAVVFFKGLI